jgi:branched-chain amino acid transport system substrate-binding protein
VKFLYLRHIFFSTLILILTGCQSLRDSSQEGSAQQLPGGGPIITKHLPAQSQQDLLPSGQPATKVALLLPLSGQQAHLGTAMLNAAQMSLFENAPDFIELVSEDTQGNPETAARAAEKVIQEGAKIIIGPLFANEATAVARVAALNQVPVLTFSNNQVVANPNVFILGFMPDQQIQRLFAVAVTNGITNIALLVPGNEAGNLLQQYAENAARNTGVNLIHVAPYGPASSEMKTQAAAIKQSGAQAVLIPEGGQQLRLTISSLLANGVDPNKVKFMGTGQWDTPDVYGDKSLNGSWFSASPISLRQNFMKKYTTSYGNQPPRLATLAYDTMSMISLLSRAPGFQHIYTTQSMTQPRGYQGIDGIFRLNMNGTVQRGLAVYEISDKQGLTVVSPAPEAF